MYQQLRNLSILMYRHLTSMVPTFVFCAIFLYWYNPSFADFPFRRSTHNSTNWSITGSKEAIGLLLDRLDVTCSCKTLRAACGWSTAMSSCARYEKVSTSDIVDGDRHNVGSNSPWEHSQVWCAVAEASWATVFRSLWMREMMDEDKDISRDFWLSLS